MAQELDSEVVARLLQEVDPAMQGVIRQKLRVTLRASDYREQNLDAMDVLGEVQLRLLKRLQQPEMQGATAIAEFRGYAATVAYHCCADYLRAKYPKRTSLKNSLRRLLDKADGFAAWTNANGDVLCGFAGWANGTAVAEGAVVAKLKQDPGAIPAQAIPRVSAHQVSMPEWLRLLEAVFDQAGGPMSMDDLIAIVAPLTGVEDVAELYDEQEDEEGGGGGSVMDRIAAAGPSPQSAMMSTERLKLFWGAVLQLLPWHRAALLMNLRDGDLDALPYYGVASREAIGEAMELKPEQLGTMERELGVSAPPRASASSRFVACWRFLPLEDTLLGVILGVTRAQVIGYRNKARERLARSLKGSL